jgi:hypothetical protein
MPRFKFTAAGLMVIAVAAGCGRPPDARLSTPSPVQGKITFKGGNPLIGGLITFHPNEVSASDGIRYDAAGLVDAKGNFKLGLNGDGSGAPRGDYKVSLTPREVQELPNSNSERIPKQYRDKKTTPLTATVKEGDNNFSFEIN